MNKTTIQPFSPLNMNIYGYAFPEQPTHQGLVKVGETSQADVLTRIRQQTTTAGMKAKYLFDREAKHRDGQPFRDKDLHGYFKARGVKEALRETGATEWFHFGDLSRAEGMTDDYIALDYEQVQRPDGQVDYVLRAEQRAAVDATLAYLQTDPDSVQAEFLWNAKPRFGKTLTTYDLARKMGAQNVLIVTNRPAIANSWYDDFMKFIAWQEPDMRFVSETDALADSQALSREQFHQFAINRPEDAKPARCLAFVSLQDLKGARFAGGLYDKLAWVPTMNWDLLVIDEAHEGVDTLKTDRAFDRISRRFTLHLSGTPFRAIASQKFAQEQIYNWSYLDEQQAKAGWDEATQGTNPYAALPTLNLFTYQMSRVVEQEVARGKMLEDGTNLDYAFNLGEFFETNDAGKFTREAEVVKFLDNLPQGAFPFSQRHHREDLRHTFWLLPRVAACKAMEGLLRAHPFFCDYEVVLAAGDGISQVDEDIEDLNVQAADERAGKRSFDRVKAAIAGHEKTITLSVSQLTTGVTIPEWTGVLMLNNVKSPALYFQAAFRAQNPYEYVQEGSGQLVRKENAYVFDFAPDRTLVLFDELANNLTGEGEAGTRQENIRELINFFPVIAEDEAGSLMELDPAQVLTIPSRLKAQEVVKRGFMSNLLFANISAIFAAPQMLRDILDKIKPEKNKRLAPARPVVVTEPSLDEQGQVHIEKDIVISTTDGLFGPAIYAPKVEQILKEHEAIADKWKAAEGIARELVQGMEGGFEQGRQEYSQSQTATQRDMRRAQKDLSERVEEALYQRQQQTYQAEQDLKEELRSVSDPVEKEEKRAAHAQKLAGIEQSLAEAVARSVSEVAQDYVQGHLEKVEEKKKKTTEDDVRDRLRGFARTIPAFLMAYGNRDTRLSNFEADIHEPTFLELTSITKEDFRLLRDGYTEVEDGCEVKIPGLFNEVVFDASIQEFFDLKDKLADYLHGQDEEDIFDYIPPQQTNQIFTPRRVVKMMVDLLQQEAPDLFTSMDSRFIDLYSKSGLYLTEVAKRLFVGLAPGIPDEEERIRWILEEQVYGAAPSDIIYNMVKNYVYGGYPAVQTGNLLHLDLIPAAKEGRLAEELKKRMGKSVRFDAIVGNPPYQLETSGVGRQAVPVYNSFIEESIKLEPKFITHITPARWYTGGFGLNSFRDSMLSDTHFRYLEDYPNTYDVFTGVDIAGGVSYFLWDVNYNGPCTITNNMNGERWTEIRELNEYSTFIRDNRAVAIVRKVFDIERPHNTLAETVSPQKPFGLPTNYEPTDSGIPCWFIQRIGLKYASSIDVTDTNNLLDKWKLLVPKAPIAGQTDFSRPVGFYYEGNTKIARPGECCTESFIVAGAFSTEREVINFKSYLFTKIARFLLLQTVVSQDVLRNKFCFVPSLEKYDQLFTDEVLRSRWNISDDEWNYIDSRIHNYEGNSATS